MTTNIGSQAIFEAGGEVETAKTAIQTSLQQHFRPEFLNRLDEIVIFKSLSLKDMQAVAKIQITRLATMLNEKRIQLEVLNEVTEWLAKEGFNSQLGAHPLKRLIQHTIVNHLSRLILDGELSPNETVKLKIVNNDVNISITKNL